MNVETGEIYQTTTAEERERLIAGLMRGNPGETVVPVSEKTARQMRIGQSRIRQQRKRKARRKA